MPQIPAVILNFLLEWLVSAINVLLEFDDAKAADLKKALGFAALSGGTAFLLFFLVNPAWPKTESIPYLVLVVLVWCLISIAFAGIVKLLGGTAAAQTNAAISLHLTGVFYLLSMVVGTVLYLSMGSSFAIFKASFIIVGAVGYLVYFPVILAKINGFTSNRRNVMVAASVPVVGIIGVINLNLVLPVASGPPVALLRPPMVASVLNRPLTLSLARGSALAPAPARIPPVFFDEGKAGLTPKAKATIQAAATDIKAAGATAVEVAGFTDTTGTAKAALDLSTQRAEAVKNELIRDGVPASGILVQAYGETHLLSPAAPGVAEPQNNRVEITVNEITVK